MTANGDIDAWIEKILCEMIGTFQSRMTSTYDSKWPPITDEAKSAITAYAEHLADERAREAVIGELANLLDLQLSLMPIPNFIDLTQTRLNELRSAPSPEGKGEDDHLH